MTDIETGPKEAVVLGFLTIALMTLGTGIVAANSLNVRGRPMPADPLLALVAGVGTVAALAACFVFAIRAHGARDGLKLVFSNMAAGLIVVGTGGLIGFFLRVVFGPIAILAMLALWAAGVYVTFAYSRKLEARF
jgi:hypothetical protein